MDPLSKAVRPSTTTSLLNDPLNESPGELFSVLIPSCNSTVMYVPEGTVRFSGCSEGSLLAVSARDVFGAFDGLALVHAATPIQIDNPNIADVTIRLMSASY